MNSNELVALLKNDPFRLLSVQELAQVMQISEKAVRALSAWGAPFITKKSRPEMLLRWMESHPESIEKLD